MKTTVLPGGESEFLAYLEFLKHWDRKTLRIYWAKAKRFKRLLVLKRMSRISAQVFLVPMEYYPKIDKVQLLKFRIGWVNVAMPAEEIKVFSDMILDKKEADDVHREQVPEAGLEDGKVGFEHGEGVDLPHAEILPVLRGGDAEAEVERPKGEAEELGEGVLLGKMSSKRPKKRRHGRGKGVKVVQGDLPG